VTSARHEAEPIGIVPLAAFVAGVAMTAFNVWATTRPGGYELTFYLIWGGPIATASAAVLGRRAALSMKQLVVVVIACSSLGSLANWSVRALATPEVLGYFSIPGEIAGSIIAWGAAYLVGMLTRRGARVRRDEKIADTFD
jgi:hypothetical protein